MPRRSASLPAPAPPADPKHDTIILSIRLASGRFETSLQFSFPGTKDQFDQRVDAWFKMVETGFAIGAEKMTVTFPDKTETSHA